MKRNLDRVREILLAAEEAAGTISIAPEDGESLEDYEVRVYHAKLLCDAGYLNGVPFNTIGLSTRQYRIYGLTMKGHDYLDAVRDKSIWQRMRGILTGSEPMEAVRAMALALATEAGKARLGL